MKQPYIRFTLLLLAIGLLLGACSSEVGEQQATSVDIGDAMPAIQLLSTSGEIVDSKALFEDKVVVLNLWATWCVPCRKEMPDLVRLSELLPKDKFLVAGIAVDNNLEHVHKFMSEIDIPFPMFWDVGGQKIASPVFKAFGYPVTLVFNRKGVLVKKIIGIFPWASAEVVAMLEGVQRTGKASAPDKDVSISTTDSLKQKSGS